MPVHQGGRELQPAGHTRPPLPPRRPAGLRPPRLPRRGAAHVCRRALPGGRRGSRSSPFARARSTQVVCPAGCAAGVGAGVCLCDAGCAPRGARALRPGHGRCPPAALPVPVPPPLLRLAHAAKYVWHARRRGGHRSLAPSQPPARAGRAHGWHCGLPCRPAAPTGAVRRARRRHPPAPAADRRRHRPHRRRRRAPRHRTGRLGAVAASTVARGASAPGQHGGQHERRIRVRALALVLFVGAAAGADARLPPRPARAGRRAPPRG
mmetsp:Transcript_16801/g.54702  ORF Transcript_16801/g.54702 Transcript_16801/m.54702 type:complete len:265 (+) Transcript_16801:710-1504(+)